MLAPTLAVLLAAAPCPAPPLSGAGLPFATGELLAFDLELALVKAGRLTLQVDRPMAGGQLLPLKARAQNTASFGGIRRLAAVAISWVDPSSVRPGRYLEESDEDGLRRSTDVRFEPWATSVTLDQRWKDQRGPKTYPLAAEAGDALAALYRLRAARLEPGRRYCLDLVGAGRFWRVTATVAPGEEWVETPAGRFRTVRVDAEATRADLPAGDPRAVRELHVWLSADARRLPVSIVSEVDAGPVSATLASVKAAPGR